ncbi:MAG: GTP-binding protein [Cellvibrionaceae bacterium]
MNEYKLVFTGTTGAGKTTAIKAVSDNDIVQTDVNNTDSSFEKLTTTVGLDFGVLKFPDGDRLRLFGTPGQERFDFMWQILAKDAFGIIILIDNSRPAPLDDLAVYLDAFSEALSNTPCVIGIGRSEECSHPDIDEFVETLTKHNFVFPVIATDVREKENVLLLIDMILAQVESDLDD